VAVGQDPLRHAGLFCDARARGASGLDEARRQRR
jgi:hypothetical protein